MNKIILTAVVAMSAAAGFSEVPFKIGIAGYTFHAKNIKIDGRKNLAMRGPRGELDIPAVFAALAKAGYKGSCNIEYERDFKDNLPGLLESVGYYRGVADAIKMQK